MTKKTIILCNPMGTDVTNFINGTFLVPQLLRGTLRNPGDVVYTVPYSNVSGASNITTGVALLDAALHTITGPKLVFSYSEGCQIADAWLANQGQSTPVSPSQTSFLSIANANSKFGGFACNHNVFNAVGYTQGQPANCPYDYTIFARQYDGVADFPTDPYIQQALVNIQAAINNNDGWTKAVSSVAALMHATKDGPRGPKYDLYQLTAGENAINGMVLIHNVYLYVAVNDPQNSTYVDTNGIKYVWSPTYPVPLLGPATLSPHADANLRPQIERAYHRPVSLAQPDYNHVYQNPWAQMTWLPVR